ncbi:MAG: gamma-glutamyl-gamma-aminobutyrate hydrolase family protein [Ignavibacteriae bacterium]|nr:gamma-glutamyl-gamma-aminobutyrate hydrolase family protein [Ignavibacteria bacterium]MBI3363637.1 gamma-glutamyl-gamma-aminobutyrate hydrolase family protein [Ignavibacteriota bacterium]
MRIVVTDTLGTEHKFQKYISWLQQGGVPVECAAISYRLDNLTEVDSCEALVLTGGHDVDPVLYGGPLNHPAITDVDRKRDDFERKALDRALGRRIPILGICRGLQLVNVHFGGTLIPDLQEAGFPSHKSGSGECRHAVTVEKQSFLNSIVHVKEGMTNSSHHQAADKVALDLKVVAQSSDGIIEALELNSRGDYPFFLLVQWHPERMPDRENPFSSQVLERFLQSEIAARGTIQLAKDTTT